MAAALSTRRLLGVLVVLRWRSLWNGARRGPRARGARLAVVMGLLVPAAYVGLFANAFATLADSAGPALAEAALALVVSAVALSSLASKVAAGELAVGTGGETEFLLAHPLSLSALVVARGLAGVATDLFDALLLLPVLAAAALVWNLGAWALLLAAVSSVLVQIAVSSLAQAGQLIVVRAVAPRRRRLVWTLLALLAGLAMALVWLVGSTILRSPDGAARALAPSLGWLHFSPGRLIAAPLICLRSGDVIASVGALACLAAGSACAVAVAAGVARVCSRGGWEQAGAPWDEALAQSPRTQRGPALGLFRKDWRLLWRDRSRLVMLLALPLIFVGIQVFGSAGWAWAVTSPTRVALLAYSLGAYAATFGPLSHMEAERRAFWILLSAPVSMGRLLAWKAAFWSTLLGAMTASIYVALLVASRLPQGAEALRAGVLAVLGVGVVAWLAVGLAAGAADLSDDRRGALGPGTSYLFLLLAGLYNLVLLEPARAGIRAGVLYLVAVGVAWTTGVERARDAFDPEAFVQRRLSAAGGAVAAVLLFLGGRAVHGAALAVGAMSASSAQAMWAGAIAFGLALHGRRRWLGVFLPSIGRAATAAITCATLGMLLPGVGRWPHTLGIPPLVWLAVLVLAQELAVRGLLQAGLTGDAPSRSPRRWVAAALSALTVLALGGSSGVWFFGAGVATPIGASDVARAALRVIFEATLPALALASGAGLGGALLARAALVATALR